MLSSHPALKAWIRNWVPHGFIRIAQSALDYVRPAPWEYLPRGWNVNGGVRGWNVSSVVELQRENWPNYVESLNGPSPLGSNLEGKGERNSADLRNHNTLVSYAYVLSLAAHRKERVALLDWGGGMGHYYLLSKAVLPGVNIDYCCQDLSLLCQAGRELLPTARFFEKRTDCFSQQYDLVLASSSLWYEKDWRPLAEELIRVSNPYLFITRMIFVQEASSYVAIQRPWDIGYRTEYLCWILNSKEFVDFVCSKGMELVREFLLSDAPHIHRAPEQGALKGFLFRKRDLARSGS